MITIDALLTELEDGIAATLFSSGMAASSASCRRPHLRIKRP
jgi:hypothetical protein